MNVKNEKVILPTSMDQVNHRFWTRQQFRSLRLRLGWSQSDIARRLGCPVLDVSQFENGIKTLDSSLIFDLELIALQANFCSEELQATPLLEVRMHESSIEQLDFKDVGCEVQI